MITFKKKDFKKQVSESKTVDELVDADGGIISGDEKFNKGTDVKTGPINTEPEDIKGVALTTNKHAANAIQPRNWWWSLTYGYGQGQRTGASAMAATVGESIDESELTAEQRMRKMVEDILSKKSNSSGIVKKSSNSDVNRNKIPDIEELEDTKMVVVGKVKDIIDSIGSGHLNGEELGILINYLVSNLDTTSIPSDYKNIIRKQL